MKIAPFALMAVAANAFTPSSMNMRSPVQLSERVDSSDLVEKALATSKKFGASSAEARLAWETVEEVDSSDNRYLQFYMDYAPMKCSHDICRMLTPPIFYIYLILL
jgi:hypothetical protein